MDIQQQIVERLDRKCADIQIGTNILREKIKTLTELKTRLISDVVIGKIDVRDVKIPEYELVGEDTGIATTDGIEDVDDGEEE